MTPEQQARQNIDALLTASGWVVQDYKQFNPTASRGIALREAPLKSGRCDYLLLVDRKAVGVAEAIGEVVGSGGVRQPQSRPPSNQPTRITAEVERRLSVVQELEAVMSANLKRARSLRQSILHKAFSGDLA